MHIIYQPEQKEETKREHERLAKRMVITYKTLLFVLVLTMFILSVWLIVLFTPNRIGAEMPVLPSTEVLSESSANDRLQIRHIVLPGESLWELADRYRNRNQGKMEWVQHIKKVNNLKESTLLIGDTLTIPIDDNHNAANFNM